MARATISRHYKLRKTQAELDFVDVPTREDIPLFLDPFAISRRVDRWSHDAHSTLIAYFERLIELIRNGEGDKALQMMENLGEPNETHFGLSDGKPRGAGIGGMKAHEMFEALSQSSAVKTGFLTSLEECELMIEGISRDRISDLTTNVIRKHLIDYTQEQCKLHGIPTISRPLNPYFCLESGDWISDYHDLPIVDESPLLLVPKSVVRFDPAYDHQRYYRHFVLEYLRVEHLRADTSLVHTLKNKKRKVYKKELEAKYPCSKQYLYEFSRDNPEVLEQYRQRLADLESERPDSDVDGDDEQLIAESLIAALGSIGVGNAEATRYHKAIIGIVEFLFFPSLLHPRMEQEIHEGRKRIDILVENGARDGVFHRLHDIRKLPCAYVPFECKNYGREIANPELDQISGRFSVNRGQAGVICCRAFEERARFIQRCQDTLKDGRGLVIPLEDRDIVSMLQLVAEGERAEVDAHIARIVDEVWIS